VEVKGRLAMTWHASATLPGERVEHYLVVLMGPNGFERRIGTKGLACTVRVPLQGAYRASVLAVNVSGQSMASNLALASYRRPRH
jgi:hypothetical protein